MNLFNNSCCCQSQCNNFSNGFFYSLFIGLDDKYKGVQIIPTKEALSFTEKICKKYFLMVLLF